MSEKLGPIAEKQFARMAGEWSQGEHVLVSGATGSGKTALARHLAEIRIRRGGHVVVFVCKLTPDETILRDYRGWTRWKSWPRRKRIAAHENRILLWPDTHRVKSIAAKRALQRNVFGHAMDALSNIGKWNLQIDEGLYVCNPTFLNLGNELAMLHAMGRSSKLTITTLTQRPSHLPLIIYSSASHAFIGRAREHVDLKRLAELGGRDSAKELSVRIDQQGRHDFLWIPVAPGRPPETVNLRK